MKLLISIFILMACQFAVGGEVRAVKHEDNADRQLQMGVLAFRPKPGTLDQWTPLAEFLSIELKRKVNLQALNYEELNAEAQAGKLDIIFTNPGHWVLLNHKNQAKSAIATLIREEKGREVKEFGGVIFTKADSKIFSLADIEGKRVATVNTDSLGGYQMQAYALQKSGIHPGELIVTKMPHDNVIKAVLDGKADVGFVRSGLLESLVSEGKLPKGKVRVINPQETPGYPYQSSTPLYPEWPVTTSVDLDPHITRALTVALLSIQPNSRIASASGIHGFDTPANYAGVEDILRELRLPPFENKQNFTLKDFVDKYSNEVITGLVLFLLLLALVAYSLYRQKNSLGASNQRFKTLFELSPEPIWILEEGRFVDCNNAALLLTGAQGQSELIGKTLQDFCPEYQPDGMKSAERVRHEMSEVHLGPRRLELSLFGCEEDLMVLDVKLESIHIGRRNLVLAVGHDITQSIKEKTRLKLAACVFSHAREGVLITDKKGVIVDVNDALLALNGYERSELIGQTPKVLRSGKHPESFYAEMWKQLLDVGHWTGEIHNKRKDGSLYVGLLSISRVISDKDELTNYVGHFTDISLIKEQESKLSALAHYDALTGLPNRVLKADRQRQAMIRCNRNGTYMRNYVAAAQRSNPPCA